MKILGIETSCDDTAAALVEKTEHGELIVHSNIIASQTKLHEKYGGVVPEVAARKHVETIIPVITEVLGTHTPEDIDAIAVTQGPGLITSLHVGVETAKSLAYTWNKPLIGINHIEGHIYSVLLPLPSSRRRGLGGGVGFTDTDNAPNKAISRKSKTQNPTPETSSRAAYHGSGQAGQALTLPLAGDGTLLFPAIALIVSGGHTELILMQSHGDYTLIGKTRDDAAGETFDKAAKMLGLPYPGGPEISKHAQNGNPHAYTLPRPMLYQAGYEFSFSGLKNAIRLLIAKEGVQNLPSSPTRDLIINDLCASIQHAIADVLTKKTTRAILEHHPKTLILAGGVSANTYLVDMLKNTIPTNISFLFPHKAYTQDNAAMIAAAGLYHTNIRHNLITTPFSANAQWELV